MGIISYAQNFEDVMLWRALGFVENGFYIDIGAQDPVIDSVSQAFYEKGWKGIHVEPTPFYADLLREQRDGDLVVQAAVGDKKGALKFFEIAGTGISTADPEIAASHKEKKFDVREIVVPCVSLADIFELRQGRDIHWLKIDVEGFEKEVLLSWGGNPARPWIIVVESTIPVTQIQTHDRWESLILAREYVLGYVDGLNRFYLSKSHLDLATALEVPPNVFDGFLLNGTASATFHGLLQSRYQQKLDEVTVNSVATFNELKTKLDVAAADKTRVDDLLHTLTIQEKEKSAALSAAQLALKTEQLAAQVSRSILSDEFHAVADNTLRDFLIRERELTDRFHTVSEKKEIFLQEQALATEKARREFGAVTRELWTLASEKKLDDARYQMVLEESRREFSSLASENSVTAARLEAELEKERRASLQLNSANANVIAGYKKLEEELRKHLESEHEKVLHLRRTLSERDLPPTGFSRLKYASSRVLDRLLKHNVKENPQSRPALATRGSVEGLRAHPQTNAKMTSAQVLNDSKLSKIGDRMNVAQERFIGGRMQKPKTKIGMKPATIVSNVEHLVLLGDVDFVTAAYQNLLGRRPDEEGMRYYLTRLRKGVSKTQILTQLYGSRERIDSAANIAGLKNLIKHYKRARIPVLGNIYRAFCSVEGNSVSEVRFRRLDNAIAGYSIDAAERLNNMSHDIDQLRQSVLKQSQAIVRDLGGKPVETLLDEASAPPTPIESSPEVALSPRVAAIYANLRGLATKAARSASI